MLSLFETFICFIEFYVFIDICIFIFNKKNKIFLSLKRINKCYYDSLLMKNSFSEFFLIIITHIMFFYSDFYFGMSSIFNFSFRLRIIIILTVYFIFYYIYGYYLYEIVFSIKNYKKAAHTYELLLCIIAIYSILLFNIDFEDIKVIFYKYFEHVMMLGIIFIFMLFAVLVALIIRSQVLHKKSLIFSFISCILYITMTIYILFLGVVLISKFYPGSYGQIYKLSDLLYYTIVTFATVGFGDIVPLTFEARFMSVIISLSNIISISLISGYMINKN